MAEIMMTSANENKSINKHNRLLDRILEQGQKLRNAMVESILKNDPLNKNLPTETDQVNTNNQTVDGKLIEAFLNGDYLTKYEEQIALNAIRTMPILELLNYQDKKRNCSCQCETCKVYNQYNFKCDLRRNKHLSSNLSKISDKMNSSNNNNNNNDEMNNYYNLLKYVDSLKVFLQYIHLNDLGEKKLLLNKPSVTSNNINETFFIEYFLPNSLIEQKTSKSKIICNSNNNHIKLCARRINSNNNVIQLKHNSTHDIINIHKYNLEDQNILFSIKYKNRYVKTSQLLGVAKFNFHFFTATESNFSCCKILNLHLTEDSPIVVGTIKVSIQLGSGKTFFGQEFLDAVSLSNKKLPESDESVESTEVYSIEKKIRQKINKEVQTDFSTTTKNQESKFKPSVDCNRSKFQLNKIPEQSIGKSKVELLFGFIYISEAHFINLTPNSFISSRLYCQNNLSTSRIVYKNSNPLYNFSQIVPLIYDDNLLFKLRENFMIIEFWDKSEQTNTIFGLTKLPLNQFYLAYRNQVILHHLVRNQLPIIGTDWWEPIYSISNDVLIGQVQVLTALGTEKQLENLQLERGFKIETVKAKFPTTTQIKANLKTAESVKNCRIQKELNSVQNDDILKKQKVDVAIQSDMESESNLIEKILQAHKPMEKKPIYMNSETTATKFSKKTLLQDQANLNSNEKTPVIRNTSDLLNSLQAALNLDHKQLIKLEKAPSIRVEISINCANHLPIKKIVRSKCKRHKISLLDFKNQDDLLPSTYVSFETMPGECIQFTNVFLNSKSPEWNYKTKVNLPLELLTNSQKRLIFKVWKKSSNAILEPNQQTDVVLGFVAVDIGILLAGLPSVQGWYNIIDFSGNCNGQINIHVTPLEDLNTLKNLKSQSTVIKHQIETSENIECTELLSRTLKRKFVELDEITQRLRQRLSQVVDKDSDDEFENDINTCLNDESDLVSFLEEARKFNQNYCKAQLVTKEDKNVATNLENISTDSLNEAKRSEEDKSSPDEKKVGSSSASSTTTERENKVETIGNDGKYIHFDKHLMEGKQRIEALLERLNCITVDPASRNISGCSSTPTDNEVKGQDKADMCNSNIIEINDSNDEVEEGTGPVSNGSETSIIKKNSECRPNPVGQGI